MMTEKEKCEKGLLYNANSEELINARTRCKDLCFAFNHAKPSEIEFRSEIIRKLFGKTEGDFWVEPNLFCDYGYNIEIGNNFYSNHNLVILDCAKVIFGENVFIAPNCGFYTAGHPLDKERRNKGLEFAKPIEVGDNVWIGANVIVLPNVKIGNDTVIGAGSVVTKDIPDGVVAVGNPCVVKRKITRLEAQKI